MKKALVIGFGISGRSAASLLLDNGWNVVACDKNKTGILNHPEVQNLIHRVILKEESEVNDISSFDLAVLSPGIPPTVPIVLKVQKEKIELLGEVELALQFIHQPVIGITGTNGKTTVTLLVEHVLNASGKKAKALGNVGIPIGKEVSELKEEIVSLELSSYQLDTMKSKSLDAAVILNITPDHLDRYGTMEKYAESKFQIKNFLKEKKPLIVEEKTFQEYGYLLQNYPCKRYGYENHLDYSTDGKDLFKKGKKVMAIPQKIEQSKSHDLENLLAAFALCETQGISHEQFMEAYLSFKKPHHRIEFVKEIRGVNFFDDSKGTNIDAVIRAVESMQGATYLIAGGVDKGAAYTPWIQAFNHKVKGICAIGQAAEKIQRDLADAIPVEICVDLKAAVEIAFDKASRGENVLLSPGCSSFDMFVDYVQRGKVFQSIVLELKE